MPVPSELLSAVLESAARLQELVPDAVLVGGSAAALYAHHRDSLDHDHVLADLRERFEQVLEAIESEGEWVTNRVVPGKLILGRLGDIEAGIRQLIRVRPLETAEVEVSSGRKLLVPTVDEALRIKAFLVLRRNQTRDYLDVAAISDAMTVPVAATLLAQIDEFYSAQETGRAADADEDRPVASQLIRQLADPRPADSSVTKELDRYRNLKSPWTSWRHVRRICRALAVSMISEAD